MGTDIEIEDILVIGIDFGTTYSGVAWAYSGDPDTVEIVTSWDSVFNHCSDMEKAPTQLCFDSQNNATTWGYGVPQDEEAIRWFKLLLLDEKDVPADVAKCPQYQAARRYQERLGKDPTEIIACFLRRLWNHAIQSIKNAIGTELLETCHFHVSITLPAIWPNYAQQRMKEAAKVSGITDDRDDRSVFICFVSEPEAAALATLKHLSKRSTIKANDTIVVCDAGGGTVDLISYVIESMQPFSVKEAVKGDGDLCGGVFLDENFLDLVKKRLTPKAWEFVDRIDERNFLNDGWEHGIKPQFCNQDKTCDDVLSVFSPITTKIETLVARQSTAIKEKYGTPPKYAILVRGFGRNRYLLERLKATSSDSTTVLQSTGAKPWTAICRGAVIHGLVSRELSSTLAIKVESRVARLSYGIRTTRRWREGKYLPEDKIWNTRRHEWRAVNQMHLFLKQGDTMKSTDVIGKWFERVYNNTDRVDATVQPLCDVKWNSTVNLESLPTTTNRLGEILHKLSYHVQMARADGTADFVIYYEGSRVGSKNVKVEFR